MLKVVEFPTSGLVSVADGLRNLAAEIESGDHGDAHNLVWVVDCGDGVVGVGLLGKSASPGAEAYYMLGLAQRKLEAV